MKELRLSPCDNKERILQEEIFHDVRVVVTAAVRKVAGCKHDDGIQTFPVISWQKREMQLLHS